VVYPAAVNVLSEEKTVGIALRQRMVVAAHSISRETPRNSGSVSLFDVSPDLRFLTDYPKDSQAGDPVLNPM